MSDYLQTAVGALVPIFALIGLGRALRVGGMPGDAFWPALERLVYFILLPAFLVEKLATATTDGTRFAYIALAAALTLTVMGLLVLLLRRFMPVDDRGFTSVFQGSIRFNTYLAIAAALGLYGGKGAAVAAVVAAIMIPLINIYCVAVLVHYAGGSTSVRLMARGIARNPLILSCVVGILLNATGIGLPLGTDAVLEIAGRAALPLGLMTVGAGLQISAAAGRGAILLGTCALKLLLMPLIAVAAATASGLGTLETQVLVIFAAAPTATSAYILARQMGGDPELVAAILTAQTLLSLFTLPCALLLTESL